jgi:phosphoglycolate phosphatase-like HAD superfamily hydrolase
MWKEDYIAIQSKDDLSFVRRDSIQKLVNVDAIIFDCDGVLIDATKSYLMAVKETVNYIFSSLTGSRIGEKLLDKLIYLLKKGGGFNNDWATSYAISLLTFVIMPKEVKETLKRAFDSGLSKTINNPLDELTTIKKSLKDKTRNMDFKISEKSLRLIELAERVSSSGFKFFERDVFSNSSISEDDLEILQIGKHVLSYPGNVGESLLITIFEGKFLGCKLFREIYGIDCKLNEDKGLIENENVMIEKEILKEISSLIGGSKFGIASGRPFVATKYTMRDLLDDFRPEAKVFLEDIDGAEKEVKQKGEIADLSKPNPYSLINCAKGLRPFDFALYLGDSMEDLMMVEFANRIEVSYLFGGVYAHSIMKDEQRKDFIKRKADLVLPSVRELPFVLKCIKEGRGLAGRPV